ncbi:MAG: RES family NAD+ phosphorylase [Proteobacteria bacterium]|nr:RES family NAD+ phosphorylase [Pseudomonadota bacterium]
MDIWQLCEGDKQLKPLALKVWRVVEDQSTSSTRQLVSSLEEHEILEQEIENSKPPIRGDCKGFDYLLFTPSRYPPLAYGSRFGQKTEPSLWYGSCELISALAERAYYRFVFILGSDIRTATDRMYKTAFTVNVDTLKGIDLTQPPFLSYREHISSALSWQFSQPLGSKMRQHSIHAFKYFSARDLDGYNIGVFSCNAFKNKKPIHYKSLVEFSNPQVVEFIDKEKQDKYIFTINDFILDNKFPFPPN